MAYIEILLNETINTSSDYKYISKTLQALYNKYGDKAITSASIAKVLTKMGYELQPSEVKVSKKKDMPSDDRYEGMTITVNGEYAGTVVNKK